MNRRHQQPHAKNWGAFECQKSRLLCEQRAMNIVAWHSCMACSSNKILVQGKLFFTPRHFKSGKSPRFSSITIAYHSQLHQWSLNTSSFIINKSLSNQIRQWNKYRKLLYSRLCGLWLVEVSHVASSPPPPSPTQIDHHHKVQKIYFNLRYDFDLSLDLFLYGVFKGFGDDEILI